MWVGEMRGRTLSNSFIIIDEAQNMSNKTMQNGTYLELIVVVK